MFSDDTVFIDHNTLKDTGYWSELFRDNPRTVSLYCEKCKCQRMHSKVGQPVKQLIHDGKKWKDIIVGLYFECTFCKEKYLEYYVHKIDPVTTCSVCGTAYKKNYSDSCPVCKTNHNRELLTNVNYCKGTGFPCDPVTKGISTEEKEGYRSGVTICNQHVTSNNSTGETSEKKFSHIRFLEKLVSDIIWKWPNENVFVDHNSNCIVWKRGVENDGE